MSRRTARKHAFKLVFQIPFHQDGYDELMDTYVENFCKEEDEMEFLYTLYKGTLQNIETIDKNITEFLSGWTLERLNTSDLALLRLAVYELMFSDISERVIINEAVEMAKVYGDKDSPKFINGILGSVSNKVTHPAEDSND